MPSRVKHFKVVRLAYNADMATKCLLLHPESLSYRKELPPIAPTKHSIQGLSQLNTGQVLPHTAVAPVVEA